MAVWADGVTVSVLCALSLALRGRRSGRAPARDPDPYEAARLAGGPERVVEAALHRLWGDSAVPARTAGRLRLPAPPEGIDGPVERALIAAWRAPGGTAPARLRARAVRSGAVRETGTRLVHDGLLLRPGHARARRITGRVLLGTVCATAALTVSAFALELPHPVALLTLTACGLTVRVACPTHGELTPAGRRWLARLRRGAPWAASDLVAVIAGERTGLPGEPAPRRAPPGTHHGFPSVGRTLVKLGKALDREDDRHPGPGADDSGDSHSSPPDGAAHHSCSSGSGCGGSY
ncbi:TIGR04222 domain-containing membrane protein [Streptomyces sp. NBC_00654]|uniref:TIGR04222 domain-containing membrane protein n=1 Tax=Streptomyces sp. NBC_00654 TaxID=2975799 RepID=UPI0022554CA5|nr:TIGR04222 domain-containing membrane protein [Streptomyces sp. NBC_00654]MCX4964912.1 TIGR04222 domain-containing membrane protein [Streptomyces sp. NBC_00654]